jgi:hypothetical protein
MLTSGNPCYRKVPYPTRLDEGEGQVHFLRFTLNAKFGC